jgi:hypothetical protein
MKVVSPAGDFEITVNESAVEDDKIVIKGQMGVWDSKIYMSPTEVLQFGKIFLNPSVILYLIKAPFKSLMGSK